MGDLTGSNPVQPELQDVPAGAEAAGAGSAAGAPPATGRSTGVQTNGGAQGAGARLRQVTMEDAEDE